MCEIIATMSVCQCCMLVHANGECCDDDAHDTEPWAQLPEGWHPAMGVEDHNDGCDRDNCECGDLGFSWQSCDGCGSALGGDRYAFVAFDS